MSTIVQKTNTNIPNSTLSIQDGTSNNTWSSLILFGKNAANYGTAINNDLVGLLENFSNISPPPAPTNGQLWYDSLNMLLKIYDTKNGWTLINASAIQGMIETVVQNRVYVAKNGNDTQDGLSWGTAKQTISAACITAAQQTALGNFTSGHVAILVASGVYLENNPISVPEGVAIVGDNLRSVSVIPSTPTLDVFHLSSKCYVYGITVRGHQLFPSAQAITPLGYVGASANPLPLNTSQTGWAFAFAPGSVIVVSPYIQNCSSVSGDPATGSGSAGNGGGGVLVDGSVIDSNSRVFSMVVDSFTQINSGGIGVKIANTGFAQLVSFFNNFCQFGVLCVDGGHVSLLNSNCSFGNYALWADSGRYLNNSSSVNQSWTGNGSATSFVTTVPVLASQLSGLRVTVGGVLQSLGTNYSLVSSSTSTTIVFLTPPANSVVIVAQIFFGSLIEASGYTMSYAGAGTTYGNASYYSNSSSYPNDLSIDQGGIGVADPNKYTIQTNGGRIYQTTTDEQGNFLVGALTPGSVNSVTGVQANASPTFRINQQSGTIDGRAFYQSIFGFMTPFVLALTRKK